MGFIRRMLGFSSMDRARERVLRQIEHHAGRGELEFWVGYAQDDIDMRKSATTMAPLVRRSIAEAGYEVVESRGGGYGDDVHLKVRRLPRNTPLRCRTPPG